MITEDRPLTLHERMERRATDVAREVKFSNSPPRERTFLHLYDASRREHFEQGVFSWPRGIIRVDSRTLDTEVERLP